MVAKIKYGNKTIINPLAKYLEGYDIECTLELNTANSLEFTLPESNKYCGKLTRMNKQEEIVLIDGDVQFVGRILDDEENIDGSITYTCEGERAYLNDVYLPAYETGEGDVPVNSDQYFMWMVQKYNSQVPLQQQFEIGKVEVSLLQPTITRSNSSRAKVWQEIRDKLITPLGGWVRVRHIGTKRIIDYLAGGGKSSAQEIKYGHNLVDWTRTGKGEDLATSIIPLGKDAEGEELTIASLPDGKLSEGLEKRGERVINKQLAPKHGVIDSILETESQDVNYLLEQAQIAANNLGLSDKLEVSAVDLSIASGKEDRVLIGDYLKVTKGENKQWFLCSKITMRPFELEADKLEFGATDTLSSVQRAEINRLNAQVEQKITLVDDKATNAQNNATQAQSTANNASEAASTAQSTAEAAQDTATAAQTAVTNLSTTVSQNSAAIVLRATKTEAQGYATTAKNEAISAASSDATTKANNAISTAAADATTKVNAIQVGGRNLLLYTDTTKDILSKWRVWGAGINSIENNWLKCSYNTSSQSLNYGARTSDSFDFVANQLYTLSFDVYATQTMDINYCYVMSSGGNLSLTSIIDCEATTTPKRYSITFSKNNDRSNCSILIGTSDSTALVSGAAFYIRNVKLEIGNKATDWTEAPEDTAEAIVTTQTQITQTADEVRMDFNSSIANVSTELQQQIQSGESGANARFSEINRYIRFVDGKIVLGETGNELQLTVQNDRVSFTQSGVEVAYFSNNKLYIKQAEVLTSLRVGNYEFVPRNDGGLALKKHV